MSIEQLWGPQFRGGPTLTLSGAGQSAAFAGRTVIQSGSVFVTVSTSLVKSDSIILPGIEVGSVGVAVNSGASLGKVVVNSIVDGTSFAFARPSGVAVDWDDTVMWLMFSTTRP